MKKSYEVSILNQKFVLRTENDEKHVKRVADYVNKIFHDIQSHSQAISTQNVAILGALNIADELFVRDETHRDKLVTWRDRLKKALES